MRLLILIFLYDQTGKGRAQAQQVPANFFAGKFHVLEYSIQKVETRNHIILESYEKRLVMFIYTGSFYLPRVPTINDGIYMKFMVNINAMLIVIIIIIYNF